MPSKKATILLVEDDRDISRIVSECLTAEGYTCTAVFTGTDALRALGARRFDLVICDLMLPGCPGERVVSYAREHSRDLPILVISARGSTSDKVGLLGLGADDYLAKPFDIAELAARVAVQIRHTRGGGPRGTESVRVGRWLLDEGERTLAVDGVVVPLTRIEYNIVEALVTHPKRVLTRPELFEMAWKEPFASDDNTVNVHVSNIRGKLRGTGTDSYIGTVWGVGFKLCVPPEDGEVQA